MEPTTGILVENGTIIPTEDVLDAAGNQNPEYEPLISALVRWSNELTVRSRPVGQRLGGMFDRDKFVVPTNLLDQMRLAYNAAETDDVVAGVVESTESLAFSKVSMYAEDPDEEDIYNQIAADIDLDSRLREMWRELFVVSQFVAAVWWRTKVYKVRGKSEKGVARKKEFTVRCPEAISLLDPLKVVPVGNLFFNKEQLAYVAERGEDATFEKLIIDGAGEDPVLQRLILGRYEATQQDEEWLIPLGIDKRRLWLLNPETVFRHTATRPQYQPFASVRMRSVFELLDMKQQLRQMDRAHLIGGTNFIIVIKKGSDQIPAKPQEIAHLQGQVRTVARMPVLVGDHRLSVEIVTPKLDNTLKPDRYNMLDARITGRLYQTFISGAAQTGTSNDDSIKLVKVIARGMESRRHMLSRTLERFLWQPIYDRNDSMTTRPKMLFHPKNIALDFDPNFATFLLDLRATHEISRETILSQFDLDQADEARMLEREDETYNDIFRSAVPFDSPQNNQQRMGQPPQPGQEPAPAPANPANQRRAGRTGGGNRNGGGAAPGTGQGQPPKRPTQ